LSERTLTPAAGAHLGSARFDDWLARTPQR
jgi:hypothetical protein